MQQEQVGHELWSELLYMVYTSTAVSAILSDEDMSIYESSYYIVMSESNSMQFIMPSVCFTILAPSQRGKEIRCPNFGAEFSPRAPTLHRHTSSSFNLLNCNFIVSHRFYCGPHM